MALICQVVLNVTGYTVGQTPAPMASVNVTNTGAAAVAVTGVQLSQQVLGQTAFINATTASPSLPPTGPGMTTSVPANGSITIGPFPLAASMGTNLNSYQSVTPAGSTPGTGSTPINPQVAMAPGFTMVVGATVQGSDGSSNVAATAAMQVGFYPSPPPGFVPFGLSQGLLQLEAGVNLINFLTM